MQSNETTEPILQLNIEGHNDIRRALDEEFRGSEVERPSQSLQRMSFRLLLQQRTSNNGLEIIKVWWRWTQKRNANSFAIFQSKHNLGNTYIY